MSRLTFHAGTRARARQSPLRWPGPACRYAWSACRHGRRGSPACKVLTAIVDGCVWCPPTGVLSSVSIPVGEQPETRFNAGRRSDLRRARRRAEALGQVTAEVLAPRSPAEIDSLLAAAYGVEAAGWKGARGSALASDAARGAFFHSYAVEAAREGKLRLCFLRIGGTATAMQLAIESGVTAGMRAARMSRAVDAALDRGNARVRRAPGVPLEPTGRRRAGPRSAWRCRRDGAEASRTRMRPLPAGSRCAW